MEEHEHDITHYFLKVTFPNTYCLINWQHHWVDCTLPRSHTSFLRWKLFKVKRIFFLVFVTAEDQVLLMTLLP